MISHAHARGHTHTLLVATLLGSALGLFLSKGRALYALVGALVCMLHIFADFWNDYGVHPCWPILNRWFYGDMIFIVEPLLWLAITLAVYSMRFTTGFSAVLVTLWGLTFAA